MSLIRKRSSCLGEVIIISRALKTENCIICGEPAFIWHGHVIAKKRMALGNLIDVKIIAGFCEEHQNIEVAEINGCYGKYDSKLMGKAVSLFNSAAYNGRK